MRDEELDLVKVKVEVEYGKILFGKEYNIIYFFFWYIEVNDEFCILWNKYMDWLLKEFERFIWV